jgi:hypothetical protein
VTPRCQNKKNGNGQQYGPRGPLFPNWQTFMRRSGMLIPTALLTELWLLAAVFARHRVSFGRSNTACGFQCPWLCPTGVVWSKDKEYRQRNHRPSDQYGNPVQHHDIVERIEAKTAASAGASRLPELATSNADAAMSRLVTAVGLKLIAVAGDSTSMPRSARQRIASHGFPRQPSQSGSLPPAPVKAGRFHA